MRYQAKPSAGIEEEHRYRMMLAHLNLEFGGGSRRRRGVAVKREKTLVERAHIPGEDLRLFVGRVCGSGNKTGGERAPRPGGALSVCLSAGAAKKKNPGPPPCRVFVPSAQPKPTKSRRS